jgi:hypothetical protein
MSLETVGHVQCPSAVFSHHSTSPSTTSIRSSLNFIRVRCPDPRALERRPGRGLVAFPCSRVRLGQVGQDLVRGVLL